MNLQRRWALYTLLLGAAGARAQAAAAPPPEIASELPGARLLGSGRLRFLGLQIYDARLWAATPPAADWAAAPLALELEYRRTLFGKLIAERSLTEMQRQTTIAADQAQRWLESLTKLIPDVKEDDRITGVLQPGVGMRFFLNGQLRGELRDAEFARLFIGIWLSPKTSEPALRKSLLGGSA